MSERLPEWLAPLLPWLGPLALLSLLLLVASLLALPWLAAHIPEDYFASPEPWRRRHPARHPLALLGLLLLKNLAGGLLLLAGIAMLVLPGQGLLTILAALLLLDFPGKRRLERALVRRPPVLRALNWLRARRGAPPLHPPRD